MALATDSIVPDPEDDVAQQPCRGLHEHERKSRLEGIRRACDAAPLPLET